MAIVDPETVGAIGGGAGIVATVKSLVADYFHREDRKEIERKLETMNDKIDRLGDEISDNATLANATFATQPQLNTLMDHLGRKFDGFDRKLDNMSNLIIEVIKDGKQSNKPQ